MEFYQKLLITLAALALFIAIFRLIQSKRKKKTDDKEDISNVSDIGEEENKTVKTVLRFPLFYRMVAAIVSVCFSLFSIAILIFQFEEWPYAILLLCVLGLPYLIMFICWSLWKVEVVKGGFIFRNYFGKRKEYRYEDLEFRQHPKGLKWYFYKNGKKVICLAYYIEDENKLLRAYNKFMQKQRKKEKAES